LFFGSADSCGIRLGSRVILSLSGNLRGSCPLTARLGWSAGASVGPDPSGSEMRRFLASFSGPRAGLGPMTDEVVWPGVRPLLSFVSLGVTCSAHVQDLRRQS
jgi:hypothetical protein